MSMLATLPSRGLATSTPTVGARAAAGWSHPAASVGNARPREEEEEERADPPVVLDARLVAAAGAGDLHDVQQLVASGANVNCLNLECFSGFTPLQAASIQGATNVVRFLLDGGADPTPTVTHRNRVVDALALALSYGHADTAAVLLEADGRGVCKQSNDDEATPADLLQVARNVKAPKPAYKVAKEWHARRERLRAHQRLAFLGGYHARIGQRAAHSCISRDLVELIVSELDQMFRRTVPHGPLVRRFVRQGWAWQATSSPLIPREFNLGSVPKAAQRKKAVRAHDLSIAGVGGLKKNRRQGRRERVKTVASRHLKLRVGAGGNTDREFAHWAMELREVAASHHD